MPLTGVLRTWNDARGFGFIAPTHGGPELFVHFSAFPSDGTRPTVGEKLMYELGRGENGRPQAVKVVRAAIGVMPRTPSQSSKRPPGTTGWLGSVLVVALLVAVGAYGFNRYKASERRLALENSPATPVVAPIETSSASAFRCDGRTTCSQMTSCTEAKWFINNCPGTMMDGNHDGTPCEQQWCTSPFAK